MFYFFILSKKTHEDVFSKTPYIEFIQLRHTTFPLKSTTLSIWLQKIHPALYFCKIFLSFSTNISTGCPISILLFTHNFLGITIRLQFINFPYYYCYFHSSTPTCFLLYFFGNQFIFFILHCYLKCSYISVF